MLILSRKELEKVVIPFNAKTLRALAAMIPEGVQDDDPTTIAQITVVIAEIRVDKARVGFEAPKCIPVHRQEVYDQISRSFAKKLAEPAITYDHHVNCSAFRSQPIGSNGCSCHLQPNLGMER